VRALPVSPKLLRLGNRRENQKNTGGITEMGFETTRDSSRHANVDWILLTRSRVAKSRVALLQAAPPVRVSLEPRCYRSDESINRLVFRSQHHRRQLAIGIVPSRLTDLTSSFWTKI
jgi:hypothetical protein